VSPSPPPLPLPLPAPAPPPFPSLPLPPRLMFSSPPPLSFCPLSFCPLHSISSAGDIYTDAESRDADWHTIIKTAACDTLPCKPVVFANSSKLNARGNLNAIMVDEQSHADKTTADVVSQTHEKCRRTRSIIIREVLCRRAL
jgi:hypothetical protein